ncbi:MAG: phosphate ABC transporter, permease protein PstA, partial [Gammaproteobacteria bacterium]|nr:phosphate ABC transporter, permease protein PstA [Gammaproteobacteria bacterium]NIO61281.1 phosphate ABC transporter, permease protein PstA [Gammaproteobacteria bacterium]
DIDMLVKGHMKGGEEGEGRIKKNKVFWVNRLAEQKAIEKRFNRAFFASGDSREPE